MITKVVRINYTMKIKKSCKVIFYMFYPYNTFFLPLIIFKPRLPEYLLRCSTNYAMSTNHIVVDLLVSLFELGANVWIPGTILWVMDWVSPLLFSIYNSFWQTRKLYCRPSYHLYKHILLFILWKISTQAFFACVV